MLITLVCKCLFLIGTLKAYVHIYLHLDWILSFHRCSKDLPPSRHPQLFSAPLSSPSQLVSLLSGCREVSTPRRLWLETRECQRKVRSFLPLPPSDFVRTSVLHSHHSCPINDPASTLRLYWTPGAPFPPVRLSPDYHQCPDYVGPWVSTLPLLSLPSLLDPFALLTPLKKSLFISYSSKTRA